MIINREAVKAAESIFDEYFALGFLGREELNLGDVMVEVGYKGKHQGFHKHVWQPYLEKKRQEYAYLNRGLEDLKNKRSKYKDSVSKSQGSVRRYASPTC